MPKGRESSAISIKTTGNISDTRMIETSRMKMILSIMRFLHIGRQRYVSSGRQQVNAPSVIVVTLLMNNQSCKHRCWWILSLLLQGPSQLRMLQTKWSMLWRKRKKGKRKSLSGNRQKNRIYIYGECLDGYVPSHLLFRNTERWTFNLSSPILVT